MEKNVGFDFYKHSNKSNVINMKKCMDYAHKVEATHIKFNDWTNNRFIAINIFDEGYLCQFGCVLLYIYCDYVKNFSIFNKHANVVFIIWYSLPYR
jgi:hypothetical protein